MGNRLCGPMPSPALCDTDSNCAAFVALMVLAHEEAGDYAIAAYTASYYLDPYTRPYFARQMEYLREAKSRVIWPSAVIFLPYTIGPLAFYRRMRKEGYRPRLAYAITLAQYCHGIADLTRRDASARKWLNRLDLYRRNSK